MKNNRRFRQMWTWLTLMVLMIGSLGVTPPVTYARSIEPAPRSSLRPIGTLLNPDGTLNLRSGYSGSLDVHGWRMTTTADGTPRFIAAGADAPHKPDIAGDEWWDGEFQLGVAEPGYAAYVYAITVSGKDVYFGGYFSRAGGINANNIVRYNTTTQHWYPLGDGTTGTVNAILISGNTMYVGCSCNDVSGIPVGGIARWNITAQSWSGVGAYLTSSNGQFSGVVNALALDGGGRLIVGGYFDHAGTLPVMNIARWDGASWSAIGSGIGTSNGTDGVFALAASGNDIYAGGYFTYPTSNIAHWNGSTWLSDTGGTNNMVRALLLNGSTLYVGGDFTQVGLLSANRIATWNGTYWSTLGAGVDNTVRSIALGADGLYISGLFIQAAGNPANYAAKWNGSAWAAISTLFDGEVDALAANGDDVYAGGNFLTTDGGTANHLARWSVTDKEWYSMGNSPNGELFTVAVSGDDVYVGGIFNSVGGIAAHNVARWNSSSGTWSALGNGTAGCTGVPGCIGAVYAIAVNGYDVYVGGTFTQVSGYITGQLYFWNTGPVARYNLITGFWDESTIGETPSSGSGTAVYALAVQGNGVVVGGSFLHAPCSSVFGSTCAVNNVVFWDGYVTYHPFTDGATMGTNGEVRALLDDGYGGMYLGGSFTSPRQGVVYFDGYDWFGEGSGIDGTIYALAADNQYLYAGGYFSNAGGSGANRIARLPFTVDGNWEPMGNSLDGTVTGLACSGSDLIAVGNFKQSGLLGLNNIARWNTTTETWSPMGSGTGGVPFNQNWGVATANQQIYVVGVFASAGGKESDFLARWQHFQTYLPLATR
ncbi:MAG TPA: hypothetical protein VMP08_06015 [Anaerolineae bacterium]|nr:hypothetical protein [Anaerolineae bacterium]